MNKIDLMRQAFARAGRATVDEAGSEVHVKMRRIIMWKIRT